MQPSLTKDRGLIVLDGGGAGLLELDPSQIEAHFKDTGALWLRGFRVTAEDYLAFIRQLADELITLNTRERVRLRAVPEIQSVTGGPEALTFHTEMGHIPGRPDFLSFWCQTPSTSGGQTLLADGIEVWRALGEPTRRLFETRRVRFVMAIPWEWWTDRLKSQDPDLAVQRVSAFEDTTAEMVDDTLVVTWRTHAVFAPRFSDERCFASNLFPNVVPRLRVSFEDGSTIPPEVLDELTECAERVAVEIEWQPSEVVLFDNTRWLHGRRAPGGIRRRRVQMLQGYLRFGPRRPRIES